MTFKYFFDIQGPRARLLQPSSQTAKSGHRLSGEDAIITFTFVNDKGGCHSLY